MFIENYNPKELPLACLLASWKCRELSSGGPIQARLFATLVTGDHPNKGILSFRIL